MDLHIGKNIKALRTQRGITQETLAKRIGVAPQSISKWERGEGYPDITFLMPLSDYFSVTLDELMGVDEEKKMRRLDEKLDEIEKLRSIGAREEKNRMAGELYEEHPYDFRVVGHRIDSLLEDPQENCEEIEELCRYILDECRDDSLRYHAIVSLSEVYSAYGDYTKAEKMIARLPKPWGSQDYARAMIYPPDDRRGWQAMAACIDGAADDLVWMLCRLAEYRSDLADSEKIGILEHALSIADTVYPAFDCTGCHSELCDAAYLLFRRYTDAGEYGKALDALERSFRHAGAYDEAAGRIVKHTSPALRGCTFDMRTCWRGAEWNEVYRLLMKLRQDENSIKYAANERYIKLIRVYEQFAKENVTDE